MMMLGSPSFEEGQEIPHRYGKKAENISPELWWEDPPDETMSFALAMVDRDPVAQNYVHWLVVDLTPDITMLPEGASASAMPNTSIEVRPYAGPLPPAGTHDYAFTVYALGTEEVDLQPNASLQEFEDAVAPYTLETATLVGTFTSQDR
jgi:Raf kinase inhibitor-like YbhB/YbcL family protein